MEGSLQAWAVPVAYGSRPSRAPGCEETSVDGQLWSPWLGPLSCVHVSPYHVPVFMPCLCPTRPCDITAVHPPVVSPGHISQRNAQVGVEPARWDQSVWPRPVARSRGQIPWPDPPNVGAEREPSCGCPARGGREVREGARGQGSAPPPAVPLRDVPCVPCHSSVCFLSFVVTSMASTQPHRAPFP